MPETASTSPHNKIMVPIDFSPSSHAALDAAAELAQRFGAEIFLLHVIPAFPNVSIPDSITEAAIIEKAKKEADARFAVSEAALGARGIKVTSSVEVANDVAGSILEAIDREKADLIVITTHGLSGWYPQVFGSITEKIVRLAQCPLLLLRTPKPESSAKVPFGRSMEWW
ncbi:MAG: universal stress protein [Acidobacteriota bacterium]|nr:universal stress protein [Acidobacteriota bacterium]